MPAQPQRPIPYHHALSPQPSPPKKAPLPSRRTIHRWLYGLGAILALLLTGAALFYFSKPTVIILTNVASATVYLDGTPCGTTNPLNRFSLPSVPPGQHTIRLSHPEYLDAEQVVSVNRSFFPIKVNLPMRPARFTLTVASEPMATVWLDGTQVGETDPQTGILTIPRVRTGSRQIMLQRTGYLPLTTTVEMPESDHHLVLPLYPDLNGYWKGTWQESTTGKASEFSLALGQTGTTLSGLWEEPPLNPTKPPRAFPLTGRFLDRRHLALERQDDTGRTLIFEGQLSATNRDMLGTWQDGQRRGTWSSSRSETKPTFTPSPPLANLTPDMPGPRMITPPSSSSSILPPPVPEEPTLSRAQSLYEQRRYAEAIAQCDAILKQDPKNQAARDLKRRIQKSLEILNVQPDNPQPDPAP
jgi:hypothetical protein